MDKNNKVKYCRNTALIVLILFTLAACGTTGSPEQSENTPATSPQAKLEKSADGDIDSDGIPNALDKCNDTPFGVGVDLRGCALDTDRDTVADYRDRCRGTPYGVKVDARGCGFDDDGDGVENFRDKCSNTIKDVSVDGYGCEWDSDNDGIVDSKDLCAGTPPGVKVESMGCHVLEVVTLSGVHFQTGSDQLSQSARRILNKLAGTLKKHPRMRVEIAGHTDNVGSSTINEQLSRQRAQSARTFLINVGINADVLTTKGYSFTQPIASNNTQEGRQQNRRVEMRIVEID